MHHLDCWQRAGGCHGLDCAGATTTAAGGVAAIKITADELAAATPLPATTRLTGTEEPVRVRRWNKTALWAFGISLIAFPAVGLITGPIAIVVACVALVGHRANQRGMGLAAAAIVLGIVAMIGWGAGLAMYTGGGLRSVALGDLTIDPEALSELPEPIARAMRSNVLIESTFGLGGSLGSGVILRVIDGTAYIVTNRHVIDGDYQDRSDEQPDLADLGPLSVTTVEQTRVPAQVEWVAPHGVDLSIISAPVGAAAAGDIQAALWDLADPPQVGEDVFAIGNPQGLSWTYTGGSVSQVRRRSLHGYSVRIIQSTAAVNPGSSGGGLYDEAGRLVGINTLTADKRFAEGLGFAISLSSLLDLVPDRFGWLTPASEDDPQP